MMKIMAQPPWDVYEEKAVGISLVCMQGLGDSMCVHTFLSIFVCIHVRARACVQVEAKDVYYSSTSEGKKKINLFYSCKSTKLLMNQNNTLCSQQQSPLSSDSKRQKKGI